MDTKNIYTRLYLRVISLLFLLSSFISVNAEEGLFIGQSEQKIIELYNKELKIAGYKLKKDTYFAKDIGGVVTDYLITYNGMPYYVICVKEKKVRNFICIVIECSFQERMNFIKKVKQNNSFINVGNGFYLDKDAPGSKQYEMFCYLGLKKKKTGWILMIAGPSTEVSQKFLNVFKMEGYDFEVLK